MAHSEAGLGEHLNRKDKSQEVTNESPKEAEDGSRVNTPRLEGGKY